MVQTWMPGLVQHLHAAAPRRSRVRRTCWWHRRSSRAWRCGRRLRRSGSARHGPGGETGASRPWRRACSRTRWSRSPGATHRTAGPRTGRRCRHRHCSNQTSMRPNRSMARRAEILDLRLLRSRRSAAIKGVPPSSTHSLRGLDAASRFAWRRAPPEHPACAKAWAVARPIPLEAPVITTTGKSMCEGIGRSFNFWSC